jgi:hypothetical protein
MEADVVVSHAAPAEMCRSTTGDVLTIRGEQNS